jgi:hypothetical protein
VIQLLAVQAVEKKTKFPEAVMVGNYECAYAAGCLSKKFNILRDTIETADDLRETVKEILTNDEPDNAREKRLYQMLSGYEVTDVFDKDVAGLYSTGRSGGADTT